jgi:hypothetical protein
VRGERRESDDDNRRTARRCLAKLIPSATSFPFPHRSRRALCRGACQRPSVVGEDDLVMAALTCVCAGFAGGLCFADGEYWIAFWLFVVSIGSVVWMWEAWGK